MSPARRPRSHTRAEAWLWTGPLGHLVGGLLDLSGALIRYALARAAVAVIDGHDLVDLRDRLLGEADGRDRDRRRPAFQQAFG